MRNAAAREKTATADQILAIVGGFGPLSAMGAWGFLSQPDGLSFRANTCIMHVTAADGGYTLQLMRLQPRSRTTGIQPDPVLVHQCSGIAVAELLDGIRAAYSVAETA